MDKNSFLDWQIEIDQQAREAEIAASLKRQRKAMRAWRWDRRVHRCLVAAKWALVAAVLALAMIGADVVRHCLQ